ncbi:oxidoreductase, DadA family protein [Gracilibacillus halophilus YIM-C55.5]|uniref:Oxidoreductase, DadA family protein n=1 Tax=Gracilibacillus halophilus YIM-C55.5 TaxID=1308866 RepID=N4WX00_9BACI|nr:FAD-dependent oxidoreductase [Gracilibacillus halophilus]ENH97571.1 oxidoreductase, DadA family protein [Gracilibacillus halophilus YIM-C55.5]
MKTFTIIGGGVAGASIAYHLAEFGHSVTIYDRFDEGQATTASAGIICPWVSQRRNKKWYRLVQEGARYYPEFIDELENLTEQTTGYKRNGAINLFKDERIQQLAYERIAAKQDDSPEMGDVRKMTKDEVKQMHPHLTTAYPAVFVEGGGQINGHDLLNALKVGIQMHGGKWIQQDVHPEHCEGTVIYTAGAWATEIDQEPAVRHQRAELLHLSLDETSTHPNVPIVMGLGPMYIVETGSNQYAIGTTHEDTTDFSTTPSEENQQYLHTEAERYFPDSHVQDQSIAVGLRPFTRDNLPFIGFVQENIFAVNGLGSTGLTVGPVIGREVAAI